MIAVLIEGRQMYPCGEGQEGDDFLPTILTYTTSKPQQRTVV